MVRDRSGLLLVYTDILAQTAYYQDQFLQEVLFIYLLMFIIKQPQALLRLNFIWMEKLPWRSFFLLLEITVGKLNLKSGFMMQAAMNLPLVPLLISQLELKEPGLL